MSFFRKFFDDIEDEKKSIQLVNCAFEIEEFLKKQYILLDAGYMNTLLSKKIVVFDMLKVNNNSIISKSQIFVKNEKTDNLLAGKNIESVTEKEAYDEFLNFCDLTNNELNIIIENEDILEMLLDGLRKYGFSGTINYIKLLDILKPSSSTMETKKYNEYYIRLAIYYNIFKDEIDYSKCDKTTAELQFELVMAIIFEKNKIIDNTFDDTMYKIKPKDKRKSLKYRNDYNIERKEFLPDNSWYMVKDFLWYTSYIDGHKFWLNGEKCRANNELQNAIDEFDEARKCCYEQLNLYISYAEVYDELKQYDDEVAILNEGISIVKGNVECLIKRRDEAYALAIEANIERERIKKETEELERKKRLEAIRIERKKVKEKLKLEEEIKKKKETEWKTKKAIEKAIYEENREKIVLKLIKNPNVCLLYRDIIKENEKINKIIDKLKLNDNFEKLLWICLMRIYEDKVRPNKIENYYNVNCYKDTNIFKDKYIDEYILNYFSKNKQDKSYYEIFDKKEKELEKVNKKQRYSEQSTSILYYVEFFAKIIIRCMELIDIVEIFEKDKELDKMYKNLITVTDDVKYITEKIYPIYKKCYASKLDVKVSKIDLEIVLYLKRKLADEIEIEITQKNKRQAIIKTMIDNYGKVLKKEESKFVYVLIKLISYQNTKDIDEYLNILKKVDEIIEKVNEKIALEEAEQEKERILSGDLRKEVTLNRLKMTYASVTSPAEFEKYVADLYERLGYTIDEVVDKNKRGGADIIAFKDDIKYVIQVKYYTKPVNKNGIIEVVAAKKLYKANRGIHVTNSYYSMSAMQFAAQNNIELVDGEMIEEYISEISQKNNK